MKQFLVIQCVSNSQFYQAVRDDLNEMKKWI